MRAVFRTDHPIPELNAQADDLIVVEDPHPDYLALVVQELGEGARQDLVEHLPNLTLVSFDGPPTSPGWIHRWLSRSHEGQDSSSRRYGHPEAEAPEPIDDPVMRALRRFIPDGPRTHQVDRSRVPYRGYSTGSALDYIAFYATETIEGTPVREGDFVLDVTLSGGKMSKPGRAAIRGATLIRIRRGVFPVLAEHAESLRFMEASWDRGGQTERLREYLTHRMTLKGFDDTSPIFILRGLRSPVSEPIEASSDDAALFHLITDAGGGMPTDGEEVIS